jgi:phage terminase small subunit
MALSAKHQQFVNEYLKCWNGTNAYLRAYPHVSADTARANAARLLADASVSEIIRERIAENAMTADEVLARLAKHARGSMADFLNVNADGATIDLVKAAESEQLDIVRKFTQTTKRYGETEIEEVAVDLYDAQAALVHLGKHLDLFSDKLTLKLEKELKSALDALEKSLDSDTYSQVLAVLAGKLGGEKTEGD